MCLPAPPPVMPISVSRASPGPLTTQPSTESEQRRLDVLQPLLERLAPCGSRRSPAARSDGQETTRTPRVRRPSAFRISKPTRTSSSGSAESETRMVSPIPAHSRLPMPMRAFDRAADQAARLGDAEMQRAIDRFGQPMIGGDREEHVARLHRHLVFVEVVVLQQLDVVERAFDQRFGAGLAVFFEQVLLEAAGVDADADRAAVGLGRAHHFGDALAASRYCRG